MVVVLCLNNLLAISLHSPSSLLSGKLELNELKLPVEKPIGLLCALKPSSLSIRVPSLPVRGIELLCSELFSHWCGFSLPPPPPPLISCLYSSLCKKPSPLFVWMLKLQICSICFHRYRRSCRSLVTSASDSLACKIWLKLIDWINRLINSNRLQLSNKKILLVKYDYPHRLYLCREPPEMTRERKSASSSASHSPPWPGPAAARRPVA